MAVWNTTDLINSRRWRRQRSEDRKHKQINDAAIFELIYRWCFHLHDILGKSPLDCLLCKHKYGINPAAAPSADPVLIQFGLEYTDDGLLNSFLHMFWPIHLPLFTSKAATFCMSMCVLFYELHDLHGCMRCVRVLHMCTYYREGQRDGLAILLPPLCMYACAVYAICCINYLLRSENSMGVIAKATEQATSSVSTLSSQAQELADE